MYGKIAHSDESNNHNNGAWIPSFNNNAGGSWLCEGALVTGASQVNDVALLQINQIFYIAYLAGRNAVSSFSLAFFFNN